ncbi:MAG TPA: hypothetical protein VF503_19750 [Sphingobium sp.]|uniref:hypothetical protein n=1 Tax=Sphingobium sp. TaxID=1912891 RepID=UPI002ED14FCB
MTSYSGYIIASPAARDYAADEFEQRTPEVVNGPTLSHRNDRVFNIPRWDEYLLQSPTPLSDEPGGQQHYQYQLYIVRGFSKMVVLAHRRRIVDYAMAQILDRKIFPNLRKVSVFVDRMIEHCRRRESEFLVTSLHGRFSGAGTHLRSISLYGDDVTQSTLYVDQHQLFNFHSSGLGRRLFEGLPRMSGLEDGEIVRVASDGFVNLNLTTRQRAEQLIEVVNFIMVNRWVEDWVPARKGEPSWPT